MGTGAGRSERRDQAERDPKREGNNRCRQSELDSDRQSSSNLRCHGLARAHREARVAAQVEIQAGPHRITAAVTRDSVEELGLSEGQRVCARVKATSVMVERDDGGPYEAIG